MRGLGRERKAGGLPGGVAAARDSAPEPASARASQAARPASTPSSEVEHQLPRSGIFASACASRARIANQAPRNVRLAVVAAEREIDHGRIVAAPAASASSRASMRGSGGGAARAPARRRARLAPGRDQHEHLAPAHLPEPRRRHHGAHLVVVDQHDARAERAGILVGRLHQLPAGRRDRARDMAGRDIRPDRARRTDRACASRRRASARASPRRCARCRGACATRSAAALAQARPSCGRPARPLGLAAVAA